MGYALMGIQAGYVSARLYKLMKGTQWKRNTVQTALLVPGLVLSVFFVLNLVLAYEKSSAAVGFFRLFSIAFLWIVSALHVSLLDRVLCDAAPHYAGRVGGALPGLQFPHFAALFLHDGNGRLSVLLGLYQQDL